LNRARAWLQGALLLAVYTAVSSFLGLILLLPWLGPLGLLVVWSTSVPADVVFVIGSTAGAVAGVAVASSTRGSITLTAVITALTYGIAAEIALRAFSSVLNAGSPSSQAFSSLGTVLVDAPLLGLAGVAFASITPALLRKRVKRLLAAGAEPLC
jgi:hypothetical protein